MLAVYLAVAGLESVVKVHGCSRYVLCIHFLASLRIGNHELHTRRRCNRSPILHNVELSVYHLCQGATTLTLSPNPHMRARSGCCSTTSLFRLEKRHCRSRKCSIPENVVSSLRCLLQWRRVRPLLHMPGGIWKHCMTMNVWRWCIRIVVLGMAVCLERV